MRPSGMAFRPGASQGDRPAGDHAQGGRLPTEDRRSLTSLVRHRGPGGLGGYRGGRARRGRLRRGGTVQVTQITGGIRHADHRRKCHARRSRCRAAETPLGARPLEAAKFGARGYCGPTQTTVPASGGGDRCVRVVRTSSGSARVVRFRVVRFRVARFGVVPHRAGRGRVSRGSRRARARRRRRGRCRAR